MKTLVAGGILCDRGSMTPLHYRSIQALNGKWAAMHNTSDSETRIYSVLLDIKTFRPRSRPLKKIASSEMLVEISSSDE